MKNIAKRTLSLKEAIEVAHIVYSLNTDYAKSVELARSTGLFNDDFEALRDKSYFGDAHSHFMWEWRALVHGAVLHGLSQYAPAVVVVEYLRTVQDIMQSQEVGMKPERAQYFVDDAFQAYVELALEHSIQSCPKVFFLRYLKIDIIKYQDRLDAISPVLSSCVARLSGAMAMLFATGSDTFEKYDYALE